MVFFFNLGNENDEKYWKTSCYHFVMKLKKKKKFLDGSVFYWVFFCYNIHFQTKEKKQNSVIVNGSD